MLYTLKRNTQYTVDNNSNKYLYIIIKKLIE